MLYFCCYSSSVNGEYYVFFITLSSHHWSSWQYTQSRYVCWCEHGHYHTITTIVPKMKDLNKLVLDKIAPDWKKMADSLDFDIPVIRSIEKRCLKDDIECCDHVLRDWISSDHGLQPKTWNTFLTALQDTKQFATFATVIEKQFQGKLTCTISMYFILWLIYSYW